MKTEALHSPCSYAAPRERTSGSMIRGLMCRMGLAATFVANLPWIIGFEINERVRGNNGDWIERD